MFGRAIGVAFAVPALFFAARGYISRPVMKKLGVLFAMGGSQVRVWTKMQKSGFHFNIDFLIALAGSYWMVDGKEWPRREAV